MTQALRLKRLLDINPCVTGFFIDATDEGDACSVEVELLDGTNYRHLFEPGCDFEWGLECLDQAIEESCGGNRLWL